MREANMKTWNITRTFLSLVAMLAVCGSADAQILRAYLSSTGNDANPCNIAAPCRLLPAALNAVANGGEIWMLDSANYNTSTVTVGKSVSILAVPGAVGSVVGFSGPAISVTAGSLTVGLRNMVLVGLPGTGGTFGVSVTGASSVTIEETLIANMGNGGVEVVGTGRVKIANSVIRNNGGYAVTAKEGATVDIAGTQMLGTSASTDVGPFAWSATAVTSVVTVTDSTIAGGSEGASARADVAGAVARVTLTRTTISNNQYGPVAVSNNATASAVVSLSGCTVSNSSAYGWYVSGTGAAVRTLGNNTFLDNASNLGSLTSTALQ
jgi:hypothetical protein